MLNKHTKLSEWRDFYEERAIYVSHLCKTYTSEASGHLNMWHEIHRKPIVPAKATFMFCRLRAYIVNYREWVRLKGGRYGCEARRERSLVLF